MDGCVKLKDTVPIQCDTFQEVFEDQQHLEQHVEKYEFACEDCNLCFLSQFEYDTHEYAEHPRTYFTYNHVSPRTKLERTQLLADSLF